MRKRLYKGTGGHIDQRPRAWLTLPTGTQRARSRATGGVSQGPARETSNCASHGAIWESQEWLLASQQKWYRPALTLCGLDTKGLCYTEAFVGKSWSRTQLHAVCCDSVSPSNTGEMMFFFKESESADNRTPACNNVDPSICEGCCHQGNCDNIAKPNAA